MKVEGLNYSFGPCFC